MQKHAPPIEIEDPVHQHPPIPKVVRATSLRVPKTKPMAAILHSRIECKALTACVRFF